MQTDEYGEKLPSRACPLCGEVSAVPNFRDQLSDGTYWIWRKAETSQEALVCEHCEQFVARRHHRLLTWEWVSANADTLLWNALELLKEVTASEFATMVCELGKGKAK